VQLRYVFSETGTGLRRNVSMSIALIVTIFVSLTLVGMGLLLNAQADKAQKYWGSKLQITVFLCNQNSKSEHCTAGEVTDEQRSAIEHVLKTHPDVASFYSQSKEQAFNTWKEIYVKQDKANQAVYSAITAADMQESYWITLKNPKELPEVESALQGMDGVSYVRDLRGVLKPIYFWFTTMKWGAYAIAVFLLIAAIAQVGNTIRLAVFARRKEIAIMRLVGASSTYIALPFLMETLVAALIGVGLAALALLAFMQFIIYDRLRPNSQVVQWINWSDAFASIAVIAVLGVLLTLIPTLFMTRKYLKV